MIIFAIQKDACVEAYNQNGEKIINVLGDLYNYTSNTVAVKIDKKLVVIDDTGKIIIKFPNTPEDYSNIIGQVY